MTRDDQRPPRPVGALHGTQPNEWRRNVTTDPRIPEPRRGGEPERGNTWRVERIDTEPISQDQYQQAVRALAALIAAWQTSRPPADDNA